MLSPKMAWTDLHHSLNMVALTIVWVLFSATIHTSFAANSTTDLTPEEFVSTYSHHRLSSDFILSVYRNLSKGVSLNNATGRPKNWRTVKAADTIRTFPALDAHQVNQQLVYKFNVSHIRNNERLRTVELRMRLPPHWKSRQELQLLAVASQPSATVYASAIATVSTHFAADEVTIMDITTAVREWFGFAKTRKMHKDLTLDLVISVVRNRKLPKKKMLRMLHRRGVDSDEGLLDAILVAYTKAGELFIKTDEQLPKLSTKMNDTIEDEPESPAIFEEELVNVTETPARESYGDLLRDFPPLAKRTERSAIFKQPKTTPPPGSCQRRDMIIDFVAIGWNQWVVYPGNFNAYQCRGRCGGFANPRNNNTNHAILQSLVRLRNTVKNVPMSCCTPRKLSPLSILYRENDGVVIKHHQEMIVDECGCL